LLTNQETKKQWVPSKFLSVQEAMRSQRWTQAMKEEIDALKRNSTWEIVNKPRDKKCNWVQMDIYSET